MTEKIPQKLGRYKLLGLLATGGMAEIHLAQQSGIAGFERHVVVKRILPHLARDRAFLDMFFDEARIVAQLNHPNIVQIYDLGKEGTEYYIAMEYLEGESLGYAAHEARNKGLMIPPGLSAGILAQVADGLEYAHQLCDSAGNPLNIIHRDVSPQNIILLFSGGVKLVDFGVARAASSTHMTQAGSLKGKLSYMAPEQVMGKEIDARSDVFSLGIVMWELLTHRRLFKRENEAATLQAIVHSEIPRIREIQPQVATELEAVAHQALQKHPDDRFFGAGEMATALREYIRRSGISSGPREVATFMEKVFAERARTKRRILEELHASGGQRIDLGVLKPETSESLPSRSRLESGVVIDSDGRIRFVMDEETSAPASRSRASLWVFLCLLFLAGGIAGGWYLSRTRGAGPGPDRPVTGKPGPADQGSMEPLNLKPEAGGFLVIESEPAGCQVVLDGKPLPGRTPLEKIPVESGREYQVVANCPKHAKETRKFTAQPSETVLLKFAPRPIPKPGTLRLDTRPWSEVFLGKRRLGITPILSARLPPGNHQLTLVNEKKGIKKTIDVTVRSGKTTTVFEKLTD